MSGNTKLGFEPGNWFSRGEPGVWSIVTPGLSGTITIGLWFLTLIFFGTFTTYIQTPKGFGIGLFYMVVLAAAMFAWWTESSSPGTPNLAIIDLGPLNRIVVTLPIGIALGLGFTVLLRFSVGAFLPFEQIAFLGVPLEVILNIVGPVIAIPIAEEAFFGGVMTPTIGETFGLVAAAVLVSITWIVWHLGTYGSDVTLLVVIFAFRFIATFVIFWTKSLVPGIVAHIIINFFGTFFTV